MNVVVCCRVLLFGVICCLLLGVVCCALFVVRSLWSVVCCRQVLCVAWLVVVACVLFVVLVSRLSCAVVVCLLFVRC